MITKEIINNAAKDSSYYLQRKMHIRGHKLQLVATDNGNGFTAEWHQTNLIILNSVLKASPVKFSPVYGGTAISLSCRCINP